MDRTSPSLPRCTLDRRLPAASRKPGSGGGPASCGLARRQPGDISALVHAQLDSRSTIPEGRQSAANVRDVIPTRSGATRDSLSLAPRQEKPKWRRQSLSRIGAFPSHLSLRWMGTNVQVLEKNKLHSYSIRTQDVCQSPPTMRGYIQCCCNRLDDNVYTS